MARIFIEWVLVFGPAFVDIFEDGKPLECFEAFGEVVGVYERIEVLTQLIM